jgi:hypothetical protein
MRLARRRQKSSPIFSADGAGRALCCDAPRVEFFAMIAIPADTVAVSSARRQILPTSVDFAAREEVIAKLEEDYDASLTQIDELNARLESCLAFLTGKPAAQQPAEAAAPPARLREAA